LKQNNRLRIVAAAVLATVTACGGLALAPAAFADTTAASATMYSTAATHSAAVRPETIDACEQWLNFVDYPVNTARAIACGIGASGLPTAHYAIAACTALLIMTGVDSADAFFACTLASVPG
jgi:hypothetical protein